MPRFKKIIPLWHCQNWLWPISLSWKLLIFSGLILVYWFLWSNYQPANSVIPTDRNSDLITPFPVGVDPQTKLIFEASNLTDFIDHELTSNHTPPRRSRGLLAYLKEKFFTHPWYQNIASSISRTLVIYSGQRTEEIAWQFAKILNWNKNEIKQFQALTISNSPLFQNGTLYPGRYLVEKNSPPELVWTMVNKRFEQEISQRYTPEIEALIPLSDTLIIASLIEREAYNFSDMREISGVIWNRLFIAMPLQIDATLQYIRGSASSQAWWPVPKPSDKFLDSPYNTYQHNGLPPTPIANPSIDAVVAALNPIQTDCLFYFHTNNGNFYCSKTYEEHVSLLKEKFGQDK